MKLNCGRKCVIIVAILVFIGCEQPFIYSPYEAEVDAQYRNTTAKNLDKVRAMAVREIGDFRVALLSDTHYHFDDLRDAIEDINRKPEISFVIVTGDIAESGLLNEFVMFHHVMSGLNKPYLTVIGNHDYLSNGEHVYRQMFGPNNYSFVFNNVKFVMFDNVSMESERPPDWVWFANELVNDGRYDHVIPFSHIYYRDKQLDNYREDYQQLLRQNNIVLAVNGHKHDYEYADLAGPGIRFLTLPSPDKRSYVELFISPSAIEVEKVDY